MPPAWPRVWPEVSLHVLSTLEATSHALTHLLLIPKKHMLNQFINSPHVSMLADFALAAQ